MGAMRATSETAWRRLLCGRRRCDSSAAAFSRFSTVKIRDITARHRADIRDASPWAAERAFVTQRDSGRHGFNFSDVFGHLVASALTPAYYPSESRDVHVVMQTWGTSIAGAAGNNLFLEFVPDAINAWHQHKQVQDSSGTR
jgi:hypothetical protein